jgi:hypothetical protein
MTGDDAVEVSVHIAAQRPERSCTATCQPRSGYPGYGRKTVACPNSAFSSPTSVRTGSRTYI